MWGPDALPESRDPGTGCRALGRTPGQRKEVMPEGGLRRSVRGLETRAPSARAACAAGSRGDRPSAASWEPPGVCRASRGPRTAHGGRGGGRAFVAARGRPACASPVSLSWLIFLFLKLRKACAFLQRTCFTVTGTASPARGRPASLGERLSFRIALHSSASARTK